MPAALGMATAACLPFCFFNLLELAVTFLFAILGFKIRHAQPEDATFRGTGGQRVSMR